MSGSQILKLNLDREVTYMVNVKIRIIESENVSKHAS